MGANDSISICEHLAAVREDGKKPRGSADAKGRRGQRLLSCEPLASRHFACFLQRVQARQWRVRRFLVGEQAAATAGAGGRSIFNGPSCFCQRRQSRSFAVASFVRVDTTFRDAEIHNGAGKLLFLLAADVAARPSAAVFCHKQLISVAIKWASELMGEGGFINLRHPRFLWRCGAELMLPAAARGGRSAGSVPLCSEI